MKLKESLKVNYQTRVIISEHEIDENNLPKEDGIILVDKSNAIHVQNMARAVARNLSREPNGIIHRIAFGNGGSYVDESDAIVLNDPNDGTNGAGWEARLYNETYSEIVDEENPLVGTDPGSNERIGSGAVPSDDPEQASVISMEVGRQSNIIATVYLNKNEPVSQLPETVSDGYIAEEEKTFEFDELGFYTPGKSKTGKPAISTVDVGTKNSENSIPPSMFGGVYTFNYSVNGSNRSTELSIPLTGSGPGGEVTYGDLCEGINTGNWRSGGDDITKLIESSITDISIGSTYPSIAGDQTFGQLAFKTIVNGSDNSLQLDCNSVSTDFLYAISGDNCNKVDTTLNSGEDAGVSNDPANPDNERERLLTHLTFSPILKKADRVIKITYTITTAVSQTGDCTTNVALVTPSPSPSASNSPTPTPTPSISDSATPTPTPTPSSSLS